MKTKRHAVVTSRTVFTGFHRAEGPTIYTKFVDGAFDHLKSGTKVKVVLKLRMELRCRPLLRA